MKLVIKSVVQKNFKGQDGDEVEYYRYVAEKASDESLIRFGSREGGHEIGATLDLLLEKSEGTFEDTGKPWTNWKEVIVK